MEQRGATDDQSVGVPSEREVVLLVDVPFGAVAYAVGAVGIATRPVRAVAAPVARVLIRPPLVPNRLQPEFWLSGLAKRGAAYRRTSVRDLADLLDSIVSRLVVELEGHLDLTELVKGHVDLDAIIAQVDLAGLAQTVIAEIDLPEIIRESTGAVASETLRGVRMQSISGDEAIGRAADRIRLRLGRRAAVPSPKVETPSRTP